MGNTICKIKEPTPLLQLVNDQHPLWRLQSINKPEEPEENGFVRIDQDNSDRFVVVKNTGGLFAVGTSVSLSDGGTTVQVIVLGPNTSTNLSIGTRLTLKTVLLAAQYPELASPSRAHELDALTTYLNTDVNSWYGFEVIETNEKKELVQTKESKTYCSCNALPIGALTLDANLIVKIQAAITELLTTWEICHNE